MIVHFNVFTFSFISFRTIYWLPTACGYYPKNSFSNQLNDCIWLPYELSSTFKGNMQSGRPGFSQFGRDPLEKGKTAHPLFLPGNSMDKRRPEYYGPWGCKKLNINEELFFQCLSISKTRAPLYWGMYLENTEGF